MISALVQTFRSSATNTESPRKSYVPYSSEMAVTLAEPLYAKYENGELNVKISVLLELKKIYNCSFDAFFEGLEE